MQMDLASIHDVPRLLDAHFGPESDAVNVAHFSRTAIEEEKNCIRAFEFKWSGIPDDRKAALATECRWDSTDIAIDCLSDVP